MIPSCRSWTITASPKVLPAPMFLGKQSLDRGMLQGVGIIADDLVAALCTLLVISVALFVLG